eukprot:2121382-Pleurochrysis_carterae.AAC.2
MRDEVTRVATRHETTRDDARLAMPAMRDQRESTRSKASRRRGPCVKRDGQNTAVGRERAVGSARSTLDRRSSKHRITECATDLASPRRAQTRRAICEPALKAHKEQIL